MRLHFLLLIVVCAGLMAGCKSGDNAATPTTDNASVKTSPPADSKSANSLVGTWTSSETSGASTASAEYTFEDGGNYSMTVDATGGGSTVTVVTKGTYKVDGDKVTMHMASMESSSKDAKVQAELDKAKAATAAAVAKMPELPGKLDWKDKDNVVLTMDASTTGTNKAQVITLKRKA